MSFDKITKLTYDNVEIYMHNADDLEKLYEAIKEKGNSKIKISITKKDKNYLFELKDKRKCRRITFILCFCLTTYKHFICFFCG